MSEKKLTHGNIFDIWLIVLIRLPLATYNRDRSWLVCHIFAQLWWGALQRDSYYCWQVGFYKWVKISLKEKYATFNYFLQEIELKHGLIWNLNSIFCCIWKYDVWSSLVIFKELSSVSTNIKRQPQPFFFF